MGSKYANILVHSTDQAAIAHLLNQEQINAYILPHSKGYVLVCEEKCAMFDSEAISDLSKMLSSSLGCSAIGFMIFDDDILWYQIYSNGRFIDEYSDNWETAGKRLEQDYKNHAETICKVFGHREKQTQVEEILSNNGTKKYVSQSKRHIELGKILRWPIRYIQLSYSDFLEFMEDIDKQPQSTRLVKREQIQQLEGSSGGNTFDLEKEVRKLIQQKRIISAMVLYQQHERCSLKEAQEYVRRLGAY